MIRKRQKQRPDLYPNWLRKDSPAKQAKERDGWICIDCGRANRTIYTNAQGELSIVFLHGAHVHRLDPDPVAPIEGQRLRARCPRCHRIYDIRWKRREEAVEHEWRKHATLIERKRCQQGTIFDHFMQRFTQVL
jgi:uncharacterized C2H2 Zn-finger protein